MPTGTNGVATLTLNRLDKLSANSARSHRIVTWLFSDRSDRTGVEAFLRERDLPHGSPDDTAERPPRGGR